MYKEDRIYQHSVRMIDGKKHYFISFTDTHGNTVSLEVSRDVYKLIQKSNRNEARIGRSDRRHIDLAEFSDRNVYMKTFHEFNSVEKSLIADMDSETIISAIKSLPAIQRRRFLMFHVKGLMLKEIAEIEGATVVSIHLSIKCAEKNLQRLLKDFYEKA